MKPDPIQERGLFRRLLEGFGGVLGYLRPGLVAHHRKLLARRTMGLFQKRPDDIFLVSYPKSGTTLAQMMLYQLTSDGDLDFPNIQAVAPWLELVGGQGNFAYLEQLPSPRLLKSHLPATRICSSQGRFIYIARNVHDVALSSYHHLCLVSGFEQDLETYLDEFTKGSVDLFGSWFEHIASWWPHRNDDNVLFLLFEDVIADLEGTVRKVAKFCDLEASEETIARTVERTSFAFMKQHNHLFDPRFQRTSRTPEPDVLAALAPGVGAETLNPQQRQILEKKLVGFAEAFDRSRKAPSPVEEVNHGR